MTEECKEYETAVQECECCGNAIFPGDDYETCHICKSNLVCEHCQYEAMDGGFSRDTCCFCAQSNPGAVTVWRTVSIRSAEVKNDL